MSKSFFFDAVVTDGSPDITYSAADFATEKRAYFSDGVLSADGLKLTAMGSYVLSLSAGAAVIHGYTYVHSSSPFAILKPDDNYDRIDLVVIRLDMANRKMGYQIVEGTADTHPVVPTPVWTDTVKEIPVAQIYVPCAATEIVQENITDVREFARFAPDENAKRAIVEEYLASLNTMTDEEKENFSKLISAISFDGDSESVLCADGEYRTPEALQRVELVRFDTAGDHDFAPYTFASEGNLYDIVLIGGGGAGGCVGGDYCRGGGGGAGAYMSVQGVTLPHGAYTAHVGVGGVGRTEDNGGDGGETSFAGFFVSGGHGGKGGVGTDAEISGGTGGESAGYRGNSGGDGAIEVRNESIRAYGTGAGSFFGSGGYNSSAEINAPGVDGENPGSGGSGAGCTAGSGLCRGGNGADGCVIIYGYRRGLFPDVAE